MEEKPSCAREYDVSYFNSGRLPMLHTASAFSALFHYLDLETVNDVKEAPLNILATLTSLVADQLGIWDACTTRQKFFAFNSS